MRYRWLVLFLLLALPSKGLIASEYRISESGWLLFNGSPVWGISAYSELWRSGRRVNIAKFDPAGNGPTRTEEFQGLTDSMLEYGFPVLEHFPGLWNDLRRSDHTKECRSDVKFAPVIFEFPWTRSAQGTACDGGTLYDLESFNPRYFDRVADFARIARDKGAVLRLDYYLQHNFLEAQTHYVDYPWRPGNSIQDTGMPDYRPAANAFYDVSHPVRRDLHRRFIRHTLEVTGEYDNVIHFTPAEYTGDVHFVRFWIDTIIQWESEVPGRDVLIGVAAPKDVLDALRADQGYFDEIDAIDLRFFWYTPEGEPYAFMGGEQKPGSRRYDGKYLRDRTTPHQLYQQTLDYRKAWPGRLVFHAVGRDPLYTHTFFMAGGSFNSIKLEYESEQVEKGEYGRPRFAGHGEPLYGFVRNVLGPDLAQLAPLELPSEVSGIYMLGGQPGTLVYNPDNQPLVLAGMELPPVAALVWFDPATGQIVEGEVVLDGNGNPVLESPGSGYTYLYMKHI